MRLRPHLLRPLLAVVLLTAILPTIVLYRAAVQTDYTWGLFFLRGTGSGPAYLGVVVAAAFCWLVVLLGLYRPRAPFPLLLTSWSATLFGTLLYGMVRHGAVLRGDAWGVEIGVGWSIVILSGVVLIVALLWTLTERQSQEAHETGGVSSRLLGLATAMVPIIVLLFYLGDGEIHTAFDRIAIALVVLQAVMIASAFDSHARV